MAARPIIVSPVQSSGLVSSAPMIRSPLTNQPVFSSAPVLIRPAQRLPTGVPIAVTSTTQTSPAGHIQYRTTTGQVQQVTPTGHIQQTDLSGNVRQTTPTGQMQQTTPSGQVFQYITPSTGTRTGPIQLVPVQRLPALTQTATQPTPALTQPTQVATRPIIQVSSPTQVSTQVTSPTQSPVQVTSPTQLPVQVTSPTQGTGLPSMPVTSPVQSRRGTRDPQTGLVGFGNVYQTQPTQVPTQVPTQPGQVVSKYQNLNLEQKVDLLLQKVDQLLQAQSSGQTPNQ